MRPDDPNDDLDPRGIALTVVLAALAVVMFLWAWQSCQR